MPKTDLLFDDIATQVIGRKKAVHPRLGRSYQQAVGTSEATWK